MSWRTGETYSATFDVIIFKQILSNYINKYYVRIALLKINVENEEEEEEIKVKVKVKVEEEKEEEKEGEEDEIGKCVMCDAFSYFMQSLEYISKSPSFHPPLHLWRGGLGGEAGKELSFA